MGIATRIGIGVGALACIGALAACARSTVGSGDRGHEQASDGPTAATPPRPASPEQPPSTPIVPEDERPAADGPPTHSSALPPRPRVVTDAGAVDAALAATFPPGDVPLHEWKLPADGPVRGVALVLHGGGWYGVGAERLPTMNEEVARWNERGWATLNITYRPGGDSIVDALRSYDALRAVQGANVPIAVVGASAGAHLTMLVGLERPDAAMLVSEAGPTDIRSIAGNGFADVVRQAGIDAFGAEADASRSPLANAERIQPPLLMANAVNDAFVPVDQMRALAAARPGTTAIELQAGDVPFVHSNVSRADLDRFLAAESALAESVALPPPAP